MSEEENERTTPDNLFYGNTLSEISSAQHISKFIIDSDVLMPEIELEQTFQTIIDKAVKNTHIYYKKKGFLNRVKRIGILLNGYGLGNIIWDAL